MLFIEDSRFSFIYFSKFDEYCKEGIFVRILISFSMPLTEINSPSNVSESYPGAVSKCLIPFSQARSRILKTFSLEGLPEILAMP